MNRCLSLLLIVLFVMCTGQTVFADSALIRYSVNGHDYQRFDTSMTWSSARTYCEGQGAHLATLTSQGENDFVYQNVAQQGVDIWLGGTDEVVEGTWRWVTNESWSFSYWFPGNPDDDAEIGQDYLAFTSFDTMGRWDDAGLPSSDMTRPFICEWERQPSSPTAVPTMTEWGMIIFTILAGLGSVYYLRRQRRA